MVMKGRSFTRQRAFPAARSQTQRDVSVLPVREEALIKACHGAKGRRPISSRTTTWPEGWTARKGAFAGLIPQVIPCPQRAVDFEPGRIDQVRSVGLEENAGDHAHTAVPKRTADRVDK